MRAVRLTGPGVVELVDVPVPQIGPSDVLLQVVAAGLCHSDLHIRNAPVALFDSAVTLGHEIAGTVVALGSEVVGWDEGDPALVHLCWSCGRCRACVRGDDNVCEAAGRVARPPTPGLGPDGGMADYVRVPARHLVAADGLDLVHAAPLTDAAMTPYHAIRGIIDVLRPGATAVVIGVGGLGHVAIQLLAGLTAARVVAADVDPARLENASAYGAEVLLDSTADVAAQLLDLTGGRGAEAILDFVGNPQTTDAAVRSVAPDGAYRIVGVGGGRPDLTATIPTGEGWPWGASLRMSYGGTRSDLAACVELARAGRLRLDVERFALDDALQAFDELEKGAVRGRAVLVP